jgi:aspartate racemase
MDPVAESPWIGLIGGLRVGSTIHYYREFVKAHEARGKVARLLIAHADMARVLQAARAGDRDGMAACLAGLVRHLAPGGAQIAAVSAVMPHMCICELTALSPIPLVNVVEETSREIRRRGSAAYPCSALASWWRAGCSNNSKTSTL